MMRRALWSMAVMASLLGGCASLPPAAPGHSLVLASHERDQVLRNLSAWRASGQASLRSPKGAESFGFSWQEDPHQQEVSLRDPLGRTVARLSATAAGAQLLLANGKQMQAASLGALLESVLHVALPVARLPDWLLGLPRPEEGIERNGDGLPETLHAEQWTIHYLAYAPVGGLLMPSLLQAQGPDGIILRLAITGWHFGEGP
ncbi:lipoprotein insertase outer membrane protein LolB [Acidithiobacillus sp.]